MAKISVSVCDTSCNIRTSRQAQKDRNCLLIWLSVSKLCASSSRPSKINKLFCQTFHLLHTRRLSPPDAPPTLALAVVLHFRWFMSFSCHFWCSPSPRRAISHLVWRQSLSAQPGVRFCLLPFFFLCNFPFSVLGAPSFEIVSLLSSSSAVLRQQIGRKNLVKWFGLPIWWPIWLKLYSPVRRTRMRVYEFWTPFFAPASVVVVGPTGRPTDAGICSLFHCRQLRSCPKSFRPRPGWVIDVRPSANRRDRHLRSLHMRTLFFRLPVVCNGIGI